ncbi:MAG: hypothetical protein WBM43_03395 [Flavobacteriaceae bacterium]
MKKYWLPFSICAFLLMGCATTYLQQSTNVSNVKKNYDKILVVSRSKDLSARLKTERQMVSDLNARGVKAESSIDVIKTESFNKELSEQELDDLVDKLLLEGYQGVVLTNLVDASQYSDIIPGSTRTAYMPVRYGRFGRYYSAYPATYWEPDRVETGVVYTLESCFYDITAKGEDNLQWVGRFKVKDPSDLITVIQKYSQELTTELLAQSIAP